MANLVGDIVMTLKELMAAAREELKDELKKIQSTLVRRGSVMVLCSTGEHHDDTPVMFQGQKKCTKFDDLMDNPMIMKARFDHIGDRWVFRGFVKTVQKLNDRAPGVAPRWAVTIDPSVCVWKGNVPSVYTDNLIKYFRSDARCAYNKFEAMIRNGLYPDFEASGGFVWCTIY